MNKSKSELEASYDQLHRDEWYDKPVSIDVTLFRNDEMSGYLASSGFEVMKISEREPHEFEYPSRRIYVTARKPPPVMRE